MWNMYTTICAHNVRPGNIIKSPDYGDSLTVTVVSMNHHTVMLWGTTEKIDVVYLSMDYHAKLEMWDS